MPEGVNSLCPPHSLQVYPSLPVACSVLFAAFVCHSAYHPLSTLSFLALYA